MSFRHLPGPFASVGAAWAAAEGEVAEMAGGEPLDVLGEWTLPPADGGPSRDFQTLHFDFGLPLVPLRAADVARVTALHVPAERTGVRAATRLVAVRPLLARRAWPAPAVLRGRLARYGRTHGAFDDTGGYTEGSLARVVEAALGETPVLPSVKAEPSFLCGTEFAALAEEEAFFATRGLPLAAATTEIALAPGELLVFDNLAVAHGRRGRRAPGELRQRVHGHRALAPAAQAQLRDRVLDEFARGVESAASRSSQRHHPPSRRSL